MRKKVFSFMFAVFVFTTMLAQTQDSGDKTGVDWKIYSEWEKKAFVEGFLAGLRYAFMRSFTEIAEQKKEVTEEDLQPLGKYIIVYSINEIIEKLDEWYADKKNIKHAIWKAIAALCDKAWWLALTSTEYRATEPLLEWDDSIESIRGVTADEIPAIFTMAVSLGYEGGNNRLTFELNARRKQIQNTIFILVSNKNKDELKPDRYKALQEELKEQINRIMREGRIKSVVFREFVVTQSLANSDSSRTSERITIQWDNPAEGRETTSTPQPRIPHWVEREGLRLKVLVSFTLTPEGLLSMVKVEESSGYPDVDKAVLEALRLWKFKPVNSTSSVRGRVRYIISPY